MELIRDGSFGMYGYRGAIILFGMVQNAVRRFLERRRGYVSADAEGRRAVVSTPAFLLPLLVYARLRKCLITPSLLPPYQPTPVLGLQNTDAG